MRFLIDESVGGDIIEFLREEGHDVTFIAERIPGASDGEVVSRATSENRILITNDKDFGNIAFSNGLAYRGVLLLRLRDETAANQVRVLSAALDQHGDRLEQMTYEQAVLEDQSVRIHGNMIWL